MANILISAGTATYAFDPLADELIIDTVAATAVRFAQSGSDVIVTDGINTVTLQNVVLEQLDGIDPGANIQSTVGGSFIFGDLSPSAAGDAGAQVLIGFGTPDQIRGFAGNDTLQGGAGNDLIYGNQGDDNIDTNAANSAGNDTLFGGQGNDFLGSFGDPGNNVIYGNFHNDTLHGGNGTDLLYGGQDQDYLDGDGGNDTLYGNLGDDTLRGYTGNDVLYGGLGNDVLRGELANDVDRMFGEAGADSFDFATYTDPSGQSDITADRVADFSSAQGDRILLDLSDFTDPTPDYAEISNAAVNSVEEAVAAVAATIGFSGNDVIFVAGATNGYLLVNASGGAAFAGADEFAVVLEGLNNTSLFGAGDLSFV